MQASTQLHQVSFNIPYPPNYGGVIDVYYKLIALSRLGVRVHVHTFHYGRQQTHALEKVAHKVTYYSRNMLPYQHLSPQPFIVRSRKVPALLKALQKEQAPILFEGHHTTAYLNHAGLNGRLRMVRIHNIEQEYYHHLYRAEKHWLKKRYYQLEARKLARWENQLQQADVLLSISPNDQRYFESLHGDVHYLPPFHPYERPRVLPGLGKYIIYYGNLSVPENIQAALFLLDNVFPFVDMPVIIAGKNPVPVIMQRARRFRHIQVRVNPDMTTMRDLIANAQLTVLPTFQATGMKLKLLEALFIGRHCLVNNEMVADTGLESLCTVKNYAPGMIKTIRALAKIPFEKTVKANRRKRLLTEHYGNMVNARYIKQLIDSRVE